jgi:D-amino-acid dehydrogenase
MHIIVLGAGLIGVSTAWYLRKLGHEVTVIDRQPLSGLETSFANGAQLSVCHAEPWASPGAPLKVLKWLFKSDAPLLFRPRLEWQQYRWGLGFLRECTQKRFNQNTQQLVSLGMYSRHLLKELREELNLDYNQLSNGILQFFRNEKEWEGAKEAATFMQQFGVERQVVSKEEILKIDPSLSGYADHIVGGTYTSTDETGDALLFVQALQKHCETAGVKFLWQTSIDSINKSDDGTIKSVTITPRSAPQQEMIADKYVVALSSYSNKLLNPLGISLNIYPMKGYSATIPIINPEKAPRCSITDDENKVVFTPVGQYLRIAGTAEMSGYSLELNQVRCEALVKRAMELFPEAIDPTQAKFWTGLRPSTPSNVPYIGTSRYDNLYINTGHGTLGWTHVCSSGKIMADLIHGNPLNTDFKVCKGV